MGNGFLKTHAGRILVEKLKTFVKKDFLGEMRGKALVNILHLVKQTNNYNTK